MRLPGGRTGRRQGPRLEPPGTHAALWRSLFSSVETLVQCGKARAREWEAGGVVHVPRLLGIGCQ